jgi:glycosyltransferase involved in cell wall biosynthesis
LRVLLIGPPTVHLEHAEDVIRALGHDVVLVSYGGDQPGAVDRLPVVSGASRLATVSQLLRARRRLRRLVRRYEPDIVHAHWLTGPGWIAAVARAKPLVVSAWGSDALRWTPGSRLGRTLARLVGRRAAAVTYDADAVRSALTQYGVPGEKLVRLIFGVDRSRFCPGPRDAALLAKLGVAGDEPVILSPRGLDPVYRPETVVAAFARLVAQRPATLLMRVAPGDEQRLQLLRDAISGTQAELSMITYEAVAAGELPSLLRSADVVVSVPESDGSSVVLLQTLACATPVIVSDLPANREWVTDEGGSIVPAGDDAALTRALAVTLDDLGAARFRATAAMTRVAQHASDAGEREQLRQIYANAIER